MSSERGILYRCGVWINSKFRQRREVEYKQTVKFLRGCTSVLDAGCGIGDFLKLDPKNYVGLDINSDNVDYCVKRGLQAKVGSVLDIPFPDDSFDGAICSHVMQVFESEQAAQMIKELARVVRPEGVVVITTLNWWKHFWKHPENARPYPPDALRNFTNARRDRGGSPMYPGMPRMQQEAIWLRLCPLIEFRYSPDFTLNGIASTLNNLQWAVGLRKPWMFDSYTVKYRNLKHQGWGAQDDGDC